VLVSDFNYELPEDLIAQAPLAERDGSRMLVVERSTGKFRDGAFRELPELLRAGDVLVINDSRVIPARLFARRAGLHSQAGKTPSGRVEVLLTSQLAANEWSALVRPAKKVPLGERLMFGGDDSSPLLSAEVIAEGEFGERTLRFDSTENFFAALDELGQMPLPPYIHRSEDDAAEDRERYQTVFARKRGSAAAPTAGLHFTEPVMEAIAARGVAIERVTLHVGLGTFQPVRVERVEEIHLHSERYTLPASTADAVNAALRDGRRVIAAGTTSVRVLEHCARVAEGGELQPGCELKAHSGETSIFISPGHEFRVVNGLLTNFHLPQSTLLMLVSAFAGREAVLRAYEHAVRERYRFFSYGDCMFLA
jgi:S-adenosylmethionine:tRNA ribosyltransferase-isomerase